MEPNEEGVKPQSDSPTEHGDNQALNTGDSPTPKPDVKKAVAEVIKGYGTEGDETETPSPSGAEGTEKPPKEEPSKEGETKEDTGAEEAAGKEKAHEETVPYERFAEVNQKVKDFEEQATRMRGIDSFCREHRITPDDFQQALQFLSLVNSNPVEAKKLLDPIYERVRSATGDVLPDDLAKMVADGQLEESAAKQWARDRASRGIAEQRGKMTEEELMRQREQDTASAVARAVNSWDAAKQKSDPSYKPKAKESDPDGLREMVLAKFQSYWNTIPMKSIEDVVSYYEKAYQAVIAYNTRFTPKPKPVKQPLRTTASSVKTGDDKAVDFSRPGWGKRAAQTVIDSLE